MSKRKVLTKEMKEMIVEVYDEFESASIMYKAGLINDYFETDFDESAFRKYYKSYKEGRTTGIEETAADKELERIAKAETRVRLERKKNEIQRYSLNKKYNEVAAKTAIEEILIERVSNIKPQPILNKMMNDDKPYSEIFAVGDEQYRGYDEEQEQIKETFKRIAEHATSKHINLFLTGDMVEGLHRASTLLSVKKTTTSQVIDYMGLLIDGILGLREAGFIVDVKMVTSNHTNLRPGGKNEFPGNDMAYIIGWTMHKLTENVEGISVEVNDIIETTVAGKKFAMLHGHQPFARNKKSLELALFKLLGYMPDYIILGHFHQYKITKEGKYTLIVTPTVKVSSEQYERQAGYVHEPAILRLKIYHDSQDFESRIIHFGKKMEITGK